MLNPESDAYVVVIPGLRDQPGYRVVVDEADMIDCRILERGPYYLHIKAFYRSDDGRVADCELEIPHGLVRMIISQPDEKAIGFVRRNS